MKEAICVKGISKEYIVNQKEEGIKGSLKLFAKRTCEKKQALKDVSFSINEGECVGLIGSNGAGKTTMMKILSGIIHPTFGNVSVLGYEPQKMSNGFKKKIALTMGQKNQLWWDIPAKDSFNLLRVMYGVQKKVFEKNIEELSELLDVKHLLLVPLRQLSLGERMKMEIIGSLVHNPKVMFLDEPTIGLDVVSRKRLQDFFKFINSERKITIMLTSHYLEDVENICNRIITINDGRILYDGMVTDIKNSISEKKVFSVCAIDKKDFEILYKYGTDIKFEGDKMTMRIDVDNVSEIGKIVFGSDKYYDILIEEIPFEEIIINMLN